jgi:large subunit ribosomal protein L15
MGERALNLTDLQPAQPRKDRKRVGRGPGSGKGKYAGRGNKGQKSRAGSHKMRAGFEGGQMPIYMRIGKLRGSTSKDAMPVGPFRTETIPVNLRDLDRFDAGDVVTPEALVEKRLIKNTKIDVKLLGSGEISKKLTVRVHGISATAREKIEAAGGTVELLREPKVKKAKHHKGKPAGAAAPAAEADAADEPAVSAVAEPSAGAADEPSAGADVSADEAATPES